jgi:hypothetical protein
MAFAWPSAAADRYVGVSVDNLGQLRIVTSDGRTITIPKKDAQVGFEQIVISADGASIGWLELDTYCCTSYPIPMRLVVYATAQRRTFTGSGLPIWRWSFTDGGKHIAFHQETVHGGLGIHYELREVSTGTLTAEFNPAVGADNQPLPNQDVPQWVKDLNAIM